jgi:hypothetical protein
MCSQWIDSFTPPYHKSSKKEVNESIAGIISQYQSSVDVNIWNKRRFPFIALFSLRVTICNGKMSCYNRPTAPDNAGLNFLNVQSLFAR